MIMIDQKITEKMFFKNFTNTDTKFLGYLAKLFLIFEFVDDWLLLLWIKIDLVSYQQQEIYFP